MTIEGMHGYLLPEDINPDGYKCIVLKIPDDPGYIRAVWGQLGELARWHAWDRDELKRGRDAAAVMWQVLSWAENCAEVGTMTDCDFCCEETNALLQQIVDLLSGDGGVGGSVTTIAGDLINNTTTTIYNVYQGGPLDVHEDLPDTTYTDDTGDVPGDSTDRERALCHAVETYLDVIWAAHEASFNFGEDAFVAIAAGLVASGSLIPGLIVYLAGAIWEQYNESVFEDTDARQAVRCCMYNSLHDADPTSFAAFRDSLNMCGFVPPDHDSTLAGWAHASNRNPINHALFLSFLGPLWLAAKAGNLPGVDQCTCEQPLRLCWDFADATQQGWSSAHGHAPLIHTDQGYNDDLHSDLPLGSVNSYGMASWGSGSDLCIFVEVDDAAISSIRFDLYHSGITIGMPFWLDLYDADWNVQRSFTGGIAGGTGWNTIVRTTVPTTENTRYIVLQVDYHWRHALGNMVINGGLGACP